MDIRNTVYLSIMTFQLECCGVNNYTDWYYSVHWPSSKYTPDSCCNPIHFNGNSTMENCGKLPDDRSVLFQEVIYY